MTNHAPFLYTTELEGLAGTCFRAFDGSNYEVRCCVARLLGVLVANTQLYPPSQKPAPSGMAIFIMINRIAPKSGDTDRTESFM